MKYVAIVFFILTCYTFSINKHEGVVIVNITGFVSNEGQIKSHIFHEKNADFFPTKSDSAFKKTKGKIRNKKARLVFDNIPYGTYALTTHHDINMNEKMDRNMLGYPKEGFGLSNNPTIYLSVPKFEECKFDVKSDTTIVNINLKFAD